MTMASSKKIALYVPDGTGIRNYLYSNVFKNRNGCEFSMLHRFDTDIEDLLSKEIQLSHSIQLPNFKESFKEKFFREVSHISRLRYFALQLKNETLLTAYRRPQTGFLKKCFYKLVELRASHITSYKKILSIDASYKKAIQQNPFYNLVKSKLETVSLDVLFLTHQRAIEAPYVFQAARALGIKTVTVIFSWDNLPKARLYLEADQYLVWSQHMKEEMALFYPEIDQHKVIVTGTPQFEFYKDTSDIETKETFAKQYDLDPTKKWICFSGDDLRTSPYDAQYLEDVASEVAGSRFRESIQILFRRCPVDYSDRYDAIIERYPSIIKVVSPDWLEAKEWTMVIPKKEDLKLLKNTAYHCEAVMNVGSTMAFDFLQYDKPTIYINYDVTEASGWSVETIYNFQHFRSMPNQGAVLWWENKSDIVSIIAQVINKEVSLVDTKLWFDTIVANARDSSNKMFTKIVE